MVERKPLVLIHLLTAFLLMALTSFLPTTSNVKQDRHHHRKRKDKPTPPANNPTPSSWEQLKSILSCRSIAPSQIHNPSIAANANATTSSKHARLGSTCGSSICPLRDVVHGNTRVIHSTDSDHSSRSDSWALVQHETAPLARSARHQPPPSKGGTQFPKLSGCYECHAVAVEPLSRRYPRPRTLSACSDCGEVFTKPDGLELHQTLRHAVSELGPEDSGRNIVEIIFKSSWLKKDRPICMIERILKVHNTQRTIARFENYRDSVKARARALPHLQPSSSGVPHQLPKKNPRCAADGNELLRFHCTTLSCSLGARGSTALCISSPASAAPAAPCSVCTIIRHGFARAHQSHHPHGVRTTASSGRAHDYGPPSQEAAGGVMRAMLVCRVIAGRIKRASDDAAAEEDGAGGWYDSVAGEEGGPYANLEELFVSNPRAILPCFVVIYRALD